MLTEQEKEKTEVSEARLIKSLEEALRRFMPPREARLMSVPEFGREVLSCSDSQAWKLARENAFPTIRNGRLVRVEPKTALTAYIAKFSKLARNKPFGTEAPAV